jgi:serine/threonine protein phosphatase PrpC
MRIASYAHTDIGLRRARNEDVLVHDPDLKLFLVCDGAGGMSDGDRASRLASEAAVRTIRQANARIEGYDGSSAAAQDLERLVEEAVQAANAEVFRESMVGEGGKAMATTLTLLLMAGHQGFMAHVGDSRLYLKRGGAIHQLSEDHTFTGELQRRAPDFPSDPRRSPFRGVLTRAVGKEKVVQVDTLRFEVLPGDLYLLCTDGLTDTLATHGDLQALLEPNLEPSAVPQRLVDWALDKGGPDNVSVLAVTVDWAEETRSSDEARIREMRLRLDTLNMVPLFQYLSHKELVTMLNITRVEEAPPGAVVIVEQDSSDCLYVMLEGEVEVTRAGRPLANLSAGSHFGEMGLFSQRPRSATVRTETDARFLVIDRDDLVMLMRVESRVAVKLLWSFSQVLSERLDDFTYRVVSTERTPRPKIEHLPF